MRPIRVLSTSVAWLPWGAPAFARAREECRPVLLSIATTWCSGCRAMDATSYADPAIATLINERFVPVRVDADERPDIAERYSLGGWPTTAFLTPEGAILGGGTYVPAERMPGALERVLAAVDPGATAATVGTGTIRPATHLPPDEEIVSVALAGFDAEHGGFGLEPKFPLVAPVRLALELFLERGDPAHERMVTVTLDAMGWGRLYDEIDGGFFHYAGARDWQLPQTEKLLETNATLIDLYLDAGEHLGIARYTERAADALRYVQNWLTEPDDGGWFASQASDDDYYAASDRRHVPTPPVTALQFADANGAMVSAALHAATRFDDEGLRAFAIRSLERVLLRGYRPGAGAAHFNDGARSVSGLLVDQVSMVAANLDAYEATGNIVYEMMAEELATFALRTMWDEPEGGCFDRTEEGDAAIGLMRTRLKPFPVNCDFARALRRLARTSGDASFDDYAAAILTAMAPLAARQGPLAAHYLLGRRALSPR